jgi:hypothetical protein
LTVRSRRDPARQTFEQIADALREEIVIEAFDRECAQLPPGAEPLRSIGQCGEP